MKKEISILLLFFILGACNAARSYGPGEYIHYMEDPAHHYSVKQIIGDYEYVLQLANPDYLISKECEMHQDSLAVFIKRRKEELKGYMFFLIKMGANEKSRLSKGGNLQAEQQLDVNRMVTYYDQQAAADISLHSDGKKLLPSTYLFENNYGLTPYNTIVVGFEVGEHPGTLTLTFNDRYTDIPAIKGTFDKKMIQNLPALTL